MPIVSALTFMMVELVNLNLLGEIKEIQTKLQRYLPQINKLFPYYSDYFGNDINKEHQK